ncbi:MAG: NADP-dependent malic enzyme [Phaeodactylibacter sp.]|nr:NADP-dependent malic enzyme [Phaeodactylibacter sp.]MCB9299786.1 NADP-dependent malic enzyme [Lewinellaceae bacterium]
MEKSIKKKDALRFAALEYHAGNRPGKIEVISSKPFSSQYDLSLAYTPGVAEPCLDIHADPAMARKYTAKGNLVAVVSNGTAVLGLGNIGALAGKPVMEGKGILFKRFADIDVFDIELDTEDPDAIINTVRYMAPTFGGINLEDIKAPECFYIEETLKELLDIPVFHDDQHGTAIISGAALLNAVELAGKKIGDLKTVISGAGAAGIACANFYIALGVKPENILMTDSKGILWKGRGDEGKNRYKDNYFRDTPARTLEDAVKGADFFAGLSQAGVLTQDMVRSMAINPIIFAMANPDPEITYPDAREARPDAIVATGRSDYPNQVNNVLGFPFIFRGALDVEATAINEDMKQAAAYSLARLAKEEVPESVKRAYADPNLKFGPDYIIPKPFDARVLVETSSAVAEAAIRSGVARNPLDMDTYRERLREKIDWSRDIMRKIFTQARRDPKRIVFPEGDHPSIIWAASEMVREGIGKPILLAKSKEELLALFEEMNHDPEGIEIIEPKRWPYRDHYTQAYYQLRQRKGISQSRAALDMRNYIHFGAMMLHEGQADAMMAGLTVNYPEVLTPAMQIIGPRPGGRLIAGMYMLEQDHHLYFLADCIVNANPSAEDLAEIALMAAEQVEILQMEPRIAMLSFSNFGSVRRPETEKVSRAVELVLERRPELMIDGPMQADVALDPAFMQQHFPFSRLSKRANVLIFPNLDAGNTSLKLVRKLSKAHYIGPILLGLDKPFHLLLRGTDVDNIINLAAIACVDAQYAGTAVDSMPLYQ